MKKCPDCGIECEFTCAEQILCGPRYSYNGVALIACGKIPDNEICMIDKEKIKIDVTTSVEDDRSGER